MDESLFQGNLVKSDRILYTPSPFAKTNLIHLQEVGELKAVEPHVSRRENLASFLFFIVLEGKGTLEYDGQTTALEQGDCVFLDCKKAYSHHTDEVLWTLKWVHFYGPNMNAIYDKYTQRGGNTVFKTTHFQQFNDLLHTLYEIAASSNYIKDMKIYETLTSILAILMEESWNPNRNPHIAYKKLNLQTIKEYLDLHYQERILLDDLSEAFYVNKFYLTRIFKEQFGVSISSYLMQVRITHAKQLLRFTNFSIEKISHECGLQDANYFSRMFKKLEGIPPGEFRKMW